MPSDKKWILLANYSDKTMLRTELALHLGEISNLEWIPQSRFVELQINQEYIGTYQIIQKVEESSNRVDIGDNGFLLEVDQLDRLDTDDVYFETNNYLYNIKEPEVEFDDENFTYIRNYITQAEQTIIGNFSSDPQEGYTKYLDRSSLIDWYLINEITKNNDANFHSSVYMSLIPGEKIKMGPLWDFDISLGNINYNGNEVPEGFWIKDTKFITPLFQDEEFITELKDRFNYFYAQRENIHNHIISKASYLENSQNYDRWQTLGEYVWPNFVYFDTYQEEVDYLLGWYDSRIEWLHVAINDL